MAAELSLSKLSFRLLRNRQRTEKKRQQKGNISEEVWYGGYLWKAAIVKEMAAARLLSVDGNVQTDFTTPFMKRLPDSSADATTQKKLIQTTILCLKLRDNVITVHMSVALGVILEQPLCWAEPMLCVWEEHLLRSLMARSLAADGWDCCLAVELQSFSQSLSNLLRVCQHRQRSAWNYSTMHCWRRETRTPLSTLVQHSWICSVLIGRCTVFSSLGVWHTFVGEPAWLRADTDGSAILLILWRSAQIIPHTLSADPAQVGALCLNTLVHSLLLKWTINTHNHQH